MPNYKRIYKENETGGQDVIGYIKPNETVRVVKNLTPQQIAIINQKDELKEHCRELGGFIHVCYVKNELLFNNLNLTRPTITRLIYLATYIDYNNRDSNLLVKYGKNHNNKGKVAPAFKRGEELTFYWINKVCLLNFEISVANDSLTLYNNTIFIHFITKEVSLWQEEEKMTNHILLLQ